MWTKNAIRKRTGPGAECPKFPGWPCQCTMPTDTGDRYYDSYKPLFAMKDVTGVRLNGTRRDRPVPSMDTPLIYDFKRVEGPC